MLEASRIVDAVKKVSVYAKSLSLNLPDDRIVEFLRQLGFEKIESIAVISKAFSLPISSAKHLVHLSPVWEDRRKTDDYLHAQVANYIENHSD